MAHSMQPGNQLSRVPRVVRVLRCRSTQRYFNGDGWSDDPGRAQAFPDQFDALRACVTHRLREVDLVLRFEHSTAEIFSTPTA